MTWSLLTAASATYGNLDSATVTWGASTSTDVSWDAAATGATVTWADDTRSNTTTRNTSRFVLLQPIRVSSTSGINLVPFVVTSQVGIYGPSFYVSAFAPIALCASGDSLV